MQKKVKILWVDDEIDLLRPHILFLEEKGYEMGIANNGADAIELVQSNNFDLIFLDENMPGLSGLETMRKIKETKPAVPIVMITKSEEEDIMDAAIGSQISDYLIKPVNPNQILLSIKKNLDTKKLVTSTTSSNYQSQFGNIGIQISSSECFNDWSEIYKRLVYWELELDKLEDNSMNEVFLMQKAQADVEFCKFVKKKYFDWLNPDAKDKPLMSHNLFKQVIVPKLKLNEQIVFIVIDNLRFDQWRTIQPIINDYYQTEEENTYCSILPTATQYSRNALFAGLMPLAIQKIYPDLWLNDDDEGSKNDYEDQLLKSQLQRNGLNSKLYFEKIFHSKSGDKIIDNLNNILKNDLVVLVYNFVDMLSHANTDMEMIRELASNDSAYRSLTLSWFQHSHLIELFKSLSEKNIKIVLTTDHGTIRVNKPIKVVGDKNTSKNLRYKLGKNMSFNPKEVFEISKPEIAHLPKTTLSSKYIFTSNTDFFAYPNNFNYYVNYYTNTYQHGGISMEEMILPLITLKSRAF